eukprot:COSAG01_NODE_19588_length_1001_cov_11.034545_1_plen_190_part_00
MVANGATPFTTNDATLTNASDGAVSDGAARLLAQQRHEPAAPHHILGGHPLATLHDAAGGLETDRGATHPGKHPSSSDGKRYASVAATAQGKPSHGCLCVFLVYASVTSVSAAAVCPLATNLVDVPIIGTPQTQYAGFRELTGALHATNAAVTGSQASQGAVAADLNGDGAADLYVANNGQPNQLFVQK